MKQGGVSIMFWGRFFLSAGTIFEGETDGAKYRALVEEILSQSVRDLRLGAEFHFPMTLSILPVLQHQQPECVQLSINISIQSDRARAFFSQAE